MDVMRFMEIEHKFVVDDGFDLAGFTAALDSLGPTRHASIQVRDRYFTTHDGLARRYILRHRFDSELHQFTIKSLEADPQVRDEISLDLGHHAGDQEAAVDAFVARLGLRWSATLEKDLTVWYFPDCEVVHYVARSETRAVRVVEFEATVKTSVDNALAILGCYERVTGFDASTRSMQSLVALLFPDLLQSTDSIDAATPGARASASSA